MNSSSKVIMAATMVMVVSLVMVLSLVLVLLAELYCSLLLRRRRSSRNHSLTLPTTTITPAAATTTTTSLAHAISTTNDHPSPSSNTHLSTNPLTTGVLQTPKPFLVTNKTYHLHHHRESSSLPASPVPSVDNFIYISNPMYSNDAATSKPTTPFETPESSPSRLETGDSSSSSSSGEEDDNVTPTLTPMKDLPEKACSVSLQDNARSLESSASESNNNDNDKDKDGGLSTSSGSPSYTSPSW